MNKLKIIIPIILLVILVFIFIVNNNNLLELLNTNLKILQDFDNNFPYKAGFLYFITYILLTSFSLPVAFIMGLLAGIIFSPLKAIILVSFASSIGATFAFTLSRFFFIDYLKTKFSQQYHAINNGFMKNGIYYLFAIRMSPIFPYFLVNLISGLTTMKTIQYYLISQIGMLPNTIIVIYIGKGLNEIIVSDAAIGMEFVILLTMLGLLPILFKQIFKKILR